jgi:acylphosphatase
MRDERTTMSDESTVRVHIYVDGRVQGVWFRQSTWQQAEILGVSGWVRNMPDGRVEAVYEGPRAAVDKLLEWTRHGPERAVVTAVETHAEEPKGERGFSVR